MLGRTNAGSSGGGKGGSAEYIYTDSQEIVKFPKQTMTVAEWKNNPAWCPNKSSFLASTEEFSIFSGKGDVMPLNCLDNNFSTKSTYWKDITGNYLFKFKDGATLDSLDIASQQGKIKVYGSNNDNVIGRNDLQALEEIAELTLDNSQIELKNYKVSSATKYKYLAIQLVSSSLYIYELRFNVTAGSKKLTLKSSNMTPLIDYNVKPAKVITQPFYDGEKIIESKALQFKPYDEGGALLDYVDDGSEVTLNLLLSGDTYFLAKDENVSLPAGYTERLKVSTLSLPKRTVEGFAPPALEPMA